MATEILYGGAAGGGKSHLLRVLAIALCHSVPGIQVYLFRRLSDDLIKNHIDGPTGFMAMLGDWIQDGTVTYNGTKNELTWKSGAKIHLCHCQHEKDVYKYQGAEIHCLLIDELTHFSDFIYRFLRNRLRLGALKVPDQWKGKLPRIVCGSNPGNIGHQFVKRTFINFAPAYEIVRAADSEGGMLRQFIPAQLDDNPTLTENDPDYEKRLEGLGDPNLVKAMRYGDWDITAGAAFEKLSRDKHILRPFEIPRHWTRFTSLDWGTAKPYSHGWYCVNDEDLILKAKDEWPERLIAKGSIIRYRELYGWNGKPNEGIRHESWQVAQIIAAIETNVDTDLFLERIRSGENCANDLASIQRGMRRDRKGDELEHIDYRIGDSAMWAEHDGPSIAENMQRAFAECGLECAGMEQSRKDRIANYQECRNRISVTDGDEKPGFYTMTNSEHFWRTVPDLQLDQKHPEKGPDSSQEDHTFDEWSYSLVSRPKAYTFRERDDTAYEEAQEKARRADRGGSANVGRY